MEPSGRQVRLPRQKRSLDTKQKLIEAAHRLFCAKGFSHTSPVEVAKEAGVAVGNFYAYFSDKEALFSEVLERYKRNFDPVLDLTFNDGSDGLPAPELFFRQLLGTLVTIHEDSKALNRELKILCHTNPAVAAHFDSQGEEIRTAALLCLDQFGFEGSDREAEALVMTDLINGIVDRVVFGPWPVSQDRILNAGVAALTRLVTRTIR